MHFHRLIGYSRIYEARISPALQPSDMIEIRIRNDLQFLHSPVTVCIATSMVNGWTHEAVKVFTNPLCLQICGGFVYFFKKLSCFLFQLPRRGCFGIERPKASFLFNKLFRIRVYLP